MASKETELADAISFFTVRLSVFLIVDKSEVFFSSHEAYLPVEVLQLVSNSTLEDSILGDFGVLGSDAIQ